MVVRAMRTASTGALAVAAFALATPIHAGAQNFCKSIDASGTVTYSDCPPNTTYRRDDRQPPEPAPALPAPSAQPPPAGPTTPTPRPAPTVRTTPTAPPAPTVPIVIPPTRQPGVPAQPSVTPKPGMTAQPGATPPPDMTAPPRATPQSSVTAQPSAPPQPSMPPQPGMTPQPSMPAQPGATPEPPVTWQPGTAPLPTTAVTRGGLRLLTSPEKRWLLAGVPFIVAGLVMNLVGSFQFLSRAFKVSVWWGLGCLLIGPVNLLFLVLHWSLIKKPFAVGMLGLALIVVGIFIAKGL